MVRRLWLALGAALITAAGPVTSPTDQAAAVAKAAALPPEIDLTVDIGNQMDSYVRRAGFSAKKRAGELEYVEGFAPVQVSATNSNWVAFRSLAYDAALLDAMSKYISEQGESITNDETSMFYQAAHQEPPPYDKGQEPGQSAELIRKVLAVGNARADAELTKLGVDPKQYADSPPPQQHKQLQTALYRKTIIDSFHDLVGLTPVQTFEGNDGKGNHEIGVVVVISPGMRDFAQQVLTSHGNFEPNPSHAQDLDKVLGDEQALLHDFGVRRMFDENGLPVIISFAQWAPATTDPDPAINQNYQQAAFSQAEIRADAQISDFLKGSAEFHEDSETGQDIQKVAERLPDNFTQQDQSTKDLTNQIMTATRLHSHVQITGVETLRRWSIKHPENGQAVVGVVRIWSAAGEKAMRTLDAGPANATLSPAATTQLNGKAGVTTGTELMKPGDF